jgi:hypothetical protein
VIFRGYIDESYGGDRNIFALSCILAVGKDWQEMERVWKLHLRARNKELVNAGRPPISRYHASDCSARKGEFEGWSYAERDAFVIGLFGIFKRIRTFTVVFDVQLKELCEVFPEYSKDPLEAAYYWLTKAIMLTLSRDFRRLNRNHRKIDITLFHDRTGSDGKYDPTILQAFNEMLNDPTYKGEEMFSTIAPLPWERCILLQPADLVAFENFKQAEARLAARESRTSYKALLNMENFGIHSYMTDKPALIKLRDIVERARSTANEGTV